MNACHTAPLLLLGLLGGCFLTTAPFPSKLAIQQLEAAKKLSPGAADYDMLAALSVACPAAPATDRQRDMACAQLWTFKASGCLKTYQNAADKATALTCVLTASASAIAFLPPAPTGENGESALKVLILRARGIELRRAGRDTRETLTDDAEIGALAAQMTPLPNGPLSDGSPPEGSYYAIYFLAGTALRNAAQAMLAATGGPEAGRPAERADACSLAKSGLLLMPKSVPIRALDAPFATRRDTLTRLETEFCA